MALEAILYRHGFVKISFALDCLPFTLGAEGIEGGKSVALPTPDQGSAKFPGLTEHRWNDQGKTIEAAI